jgi:hypothetical protein
MDDTTQQNAPLVEEAASAAKAMEQQAQQLVTQIAFFRTTHGAVTDAKVSSVATRPSASIKAFSRPTAKRPAARPAASRPVAVSLAKASGGDTSWQEF